MTGAYSETWKVVRVRYLVAVFIFPLFYLPGANSIYESLGPYAPPYAFDLAIILYLQTIWCLATYITATLPVGIPIRTVIGRRPGKSEIVSGLKLSAWLLAASIGAAYALFLPLSYWVPTFVTFWFIETPDLVFFYDGSFPVLANLLILLSLCVIAPILEEIGFRGLILHRWAHKYGLKSAILGSSFVFGILHPDPIGAFLFGVGMCILYLRYQSIIVPIVCHSIYNIVVWLIELGYIVAQGPEYEYTLETFQNEWPIGAVAITITCVWALLYVRRYSYSMPWKLPAA